MTMNGRCLRKSVRNLFKHDSASSRLGSKAERSKNRRLIDAGPEEEEVAGVKAESGKPLPVCRGLLKL